MSYILDALRKADAQRERDASRGIHAQAASLGSGRDSSDAAPRVFMWGAIAAGVAVIAIAGWYFTRTPAPSAQMPSAQVAQPSPLTTLPAATPLAMQAPVVPLPQQGTTAAANAISPPAPPPPPVAMRSPPTFEPAPPPRAAQPQFQPGPRPLVAAAAAPTPAAAPATTGLPPDAPKVAITGGVYSPNPAQRMLIVNGNVYNEGSEVAPGLVVDKIEARTAVLKFRGARYTVAY